ncbi:MAG TPA: metallophosphoesterase, partial [Rhabdochlamydiaceae bacterium]
KICKLRIGFNMSRLIISDVHGCYKTLLALIYKLPKDIPITFAGDLIDRAADSRKVIEFVKNGGYDCVLGNHEQMMIDELKFKKDKNGNEYPFTDVYHGIWELNGGDKCLDSYELSDGSSDVVALKEHVAWLKTLPYYIEYKDLKNSNGDYLLVTHTTASDVWDEMNHESPAFQNAVIWDRIPNPNPIPGVYNLYGHTPQPDGATVKDHFACIDGGAYFKRSPYGRLIALQFPELIVFEQENCE